MTLLKALGFGFMIFIILYVVAQFVMPQQTDAFFDYDWSEVWTDLDKKARAGADCKPITTVHRKMGQISPYIWIVPDSCEQGLPHTRSTDVIAIPKSFPKSRLAVTIEHEKIHLYQRLAPDSWKKFYRIKWNYEIYKEPPVGMPQKLITMRRSNPDTAAAPWACWNKIHWSVPVYRSENDLSLSGAAVMWWNSSDSTINPHPPDTWTTFFGDDIHQNEHPHEMAAEFLSGPLKRIPDYDTLEEDLPDDASQAIRILDEAWRYDQISPQV
jgi:hypothetical protein